LAPTRYRNQLEPREPQNISVSSDDVYVNHRTSNKQRDPLTTGLLPHHKYLEAEASVRTPGEPFPDSDWTVTFWSYPEQRGWLTDDTQSEWFQCSNEEAATRAQEWLYLYTLSRFLGIPIDISMISKPSASTGQMTIDSTMLPQLLQEWATRTQQSNSEPCGMHDGDFSQGYVDKVLAVLTRILQECHHLDGHLEPSRSIRFSVEILVETMAKAIWRFTTNDIAKRWMIWKLGPTPLLEKRMARAGWCRSQIAKIWYQYLPSTVYYLSSLPNRRTFGGSPHPLCTADHCTSSGVDPTTYEPLHRKSCVSQPADCRRCSMVGVDTSRVADIILQGSIPLIEIRPQPDGSVGLEVVPHKSSLRYVAVSHVWSGGLGNVKANAMLSCQLRYLHSILLRLRENGDDDLDRRQGSRKFQDAIDEARFKCGFGREKMPLYLWIDTLCIPVGLSYKAAYLKTLYQMAQIYIMAQCVIVLDPELQNMNHRLMQKEQTFAHILCSAWMSRSWTFQEACMARIWFVQFADGYFTVDKQYFEFQKVSEQLHQKTDDSESGPPLAYNVPRTATMSESRMHLMHDVTSWFREMPVLAKIRNRDPRELMSKLEDWKNFALAWNGLRCRSTTKPADLYGILAVVVDLSAGEILKLQPEERFKAILRSQTTLPLPLLYQCGFKSIDDRGFDTWVPSAIKGDRLDLYSGYVTFGPQGLLLAPGQWSNLSKPQAVLVTSARKSGRFLNVEVGESQAIRTIELLGNSTSPVSDASGRLLCCVFDDTLAVAKVSGRGTFAPGACLVIHSQKDSVYHASYACPIRISEPRPSRSGNQIPLSGDIQVQSSTISGTLVDWQKCSILIQSDLASWPSPSAHVSKRQASKHVIIRNASVWCQLSYNAISQGPYLIAFAVLHVRRHDPTARKLSWLLLSRWLGIVIESIWEGAILFVWDHRRAVRWSDQLYGTFTKSPIIRMKGLAQYPVPIAKALLLAAALVFTGLYCSHKESWMRTSAIVLGADVGLSSAYVSLLIYLSFKYANGQYRPFTLNVFTDLPEDPFEKNESTLLFWEEQTRPDVDHRYPIAIMAWRIVDYFKRRRSAYRNDDGLACRT
ncbi:MAG: hypothetical protein Q9184_006803, partial [Pyrenodesmia sp. 2 TL-2023]